MRFAVHHHTNPAAKIMIQTVAAGLLCLLADWSLGYHGWALNYAIPALLLLANGLNLILMSIHHMSWHSYLIFLILYAAMALPLLVLLLVGSITEPALTIAVLTSSILILTASFLFGKGKVRTELRRRFHI